jgi:hypothetical protein
VMRWDGMGMDWPYARLATFLSCVPSSGGFGSNRLAYGPHHADCAGLRAITNKVKRKLCNLTCIIRDST